MLDATKIVPEELVPSFPVGRLVLNRNPDNFFAETEQVAFCVGTSSPASTFRTIHCWPAASTRTSTPRFRAGRSDFHEIPINAPVAQVHNNQRDGMHRQAIIAAAFVQPNSLAGGVRSRPGRRGSSRSRSGARKASQGSRQGRAVGR